MTNKADEAALAAEKARLALAHAGGLAHLRRHVIEASPTLSDRTIDPSLLPDITLPPFEGMVVKVPEPLPITEEELHEAFDRLAFEVAPRVPRGRGQPIQMGDELYLNLIGYMGGHLLPMSAHESLRLLLAPDIFMPGFGTQLEGTNVGEAAIVSLPVPDDFPIVEARGEEIVFAVEVSDAFQVSPLDPKDPTLFSLIGLGSDLKTTLEAIMLLLLDQRTRALSKGIMTHLLDAVCAKVEVAIPPTLVEAELNTLWAQTEGRFLHEKGIGQDDIETSWEGWLADEELNTMATKRVKNGLVMYAIAQQRGISTEPAVIEGFIGDVVAALGVVLPSDGIDLSRPFKKREQLIDQFVYAQALSALSQAVAIQVGENPPIQLGAETSLSSQIPS